MRSILSIDGGGVRGIIPLACLVKLEAEESKPSREIFDMIAGTSTGAVIAAGLALGISARGLLAMYRNLAHEAFARLPWWSILFNLGNHRYSAQFISDTLLEIGADTNLNSLPLDVLITAKNTGSGRTDFFVRDNPGNASRWGTLSLRDAVLASIAAPTYFPAHQSRVLSQEYTWVDGGVGVHGNPCYQSAVEALFYTDGKYKPGETLLLAFGTGRPPNTIDAPRANAVGWLNWTVSELLEDSAEWQTFITRMEYGDTGRVDFRRYQVDLAPDVMDELGVRVPSGQDVTQIGLDSLWALDLLQEIGRAFADRIDYDDPAGLHLKSSLNE